jgi:hypothetical protein
MSADSVLETTMKISMLPAWIRENMLFVSCTAQWVQSPELIILGINSGQGFPMGMSDMSPILGAVEKY